MGRKPELGAVIGNERAGEFNRREDDLLSSERGVNW